MLHRRQSTRFEHGHAAGEIKDAETQKVFWDRHYMCLNVFNPTDGGKDYRDGLHRKIAGLETRVEKLIELLDANNINHDSITGSDLPF